MRRREREQKRGRKGRKKRKGERENKYIEGNLANSTLLALTKDSDINHSRPRNAFWQKTSHAKVVDPCVIFCEIAEGESARLRQKLPRRVSSLMQGAIWSIPLRQVEVSITG